MIGTALVDLYHGFGVALEPHNLMWCFLGVFLGNMVGVGGTLLFSYLLQVPMPILTWPGANL